MKASIRFFDLQLKHTFSIAKFSRNSTPIVFVELEQDGITGIGEGSMVPYMGESPDTANVFFKKINWLLMASFSGMEEIHQYLESLSPGNPAVKAAVDLALHDLQGKKDGIPCYQMFGADPENMPVTSYTIGIDTPEILREKLHDADAFKVIKMKLGRENDEELIRTVRELTDLPLYVDANQGWNDRKKAIDKIYWLHDQGVQLIEQPMDKNDLEGNAWLTERSPVPIIADEAVQRLANLPDIKGAYHGINVKLMKSTGLFEGHKMIVEAKKMKIESWKWMINFVCH
ncbi:MAG: dipeptide epimerase [Chitinophagaceae bacterium]|nr:MAG: dipeptide epimerase [Chitinophagaceae bacterium]